MLKVLLQKQLAEIFRTYFYNAKTNKARSRGATIAYLVGFALLMVGLLGGIFAYLSVSLCGALSAVGMDWLFFALMGLLAVFLGAFGSVFNTYSSLYLAKDNDLLLSMPIPVRTIMASRLLGVYLMGLMYSGVVILPAVIVYWIMVSASAAAIAGGVLLVALISLFVLTLSCALGWVVAKISLKLKNKSFITVFVSLVFLGAYYFFYFRAQTLIQNLVANAAVYGANIQRSAYPLYLFGRVGTGDPLAMGIVSAAFAALFLLLYRLISRSFLKIATSSGKQEKKVYRETRTERQSASAALLRKEFSRFTASPSYMLNCGLGTLMLPVAGVVLLVYQAKIRDLELLLGAEFASLLFIAAVCLLSSMNDMAAPSVSLEGKSLWLAQSLPVKPWQVLRAKLAVHLTLTGVPAAVCYVLLAFAHPFSAAELLLGAVLIAGYVLLMASFGLFVGLKMPNLHWTNEITPIKQGGAVMLALFSGFAYAALIVVGYLLLGSKIGLTAYLAAFAALTLLLAALLLRWLHKTGCRIFASL